MYIFLCKILSPPPSPLWAYHTPGLMIWKKWIYNSWGCFNSSIDFSGQFFFDKEIFKYSYVKLDPALLLHPTDHDSKKMESTLPEDASSQVPVFWAILFLRRRFFMNTKKISMIKEGVYLHFKKLESPSSCDALCQVWLQSTKAFLREI